MEKLLIWKNNLINYQIFDKKIKISADKCRYFFLRFMILALKWFITKSFGDEAQALFMYIVETWKKWKTMGKSITSEVSVVEK